MIIFQPSTTHQDEKPWRSGSVLHLSLMWGSHTIISVEATNKKVQQSKAYRTSFLRSRLFPITLKEENRINCTRDTTQHPR